MKILFKNSKGKTVTLEVEGSTTIGKVKLMIKNEINSTKIIRLLYAGDVMKDGDTIDDYGVDNLDSIVYTEEYQSGI